MTSIRKNNSLFKKMRSKGQFSSARKEKSKERLKQNSFKVSSVVDVNACGDCPVDLESESETVTWQTGRRVVELGFLASALICENCHSRIHLADIKKEKRFGLASILDIKCGECKCICSVATGKRHKTEQSGVSRCFDVNTKFAAAMINAGVGETQITNIMAELNIPSPHHNTVKKREREVGETFEKVAMQSCSSAIEDEIDSTERKGHDGATVLLDGGWQKRGSGQNYNSLSGHVTIIGSETKKCVGFGVAKKSCRICKSSEKKSKLSARHSCRRNYNGSSKGMESFLAVQGIKHLKNQGLNVKTVVMDDDSTTYSRIKKAFTDDLEKCSDKNHVAKNFTNELYKIKDKNKSLTTNVLTYIKKCFSYAVSQNKGNPTGLKRSIQAVVPHAYGSHEMCTDQEWCRYKYENEFKHKSLPYGKDLTDDSLKRDLDILMGKYSTDEMSKKLAELQSTNAVENMNQIIARKAPKSMHFSGSESLDYRVSASTLQKNEGHTYICKVNDEHRLTPGKVTAVRFGNLDKKREAKASRQASHDFKRRRLELKDDRKIQQVFHENLEGVSYKTGVVATAEVSETETEDIPQPLLISPENCQFHGNSTVLFDIETTGFGADANIIQLAAMDSRSGKTFNTYIYPPNGVIPTAVTHITNIEIHGKNMYQNSESVLSTDTRSALINFQAYLEPFGKSVLVAHNVLFDSKILMYSCRKYGVELPNVEGFGDTLALFKKEYPDRKKSKAGYKQVNLVKDILGTEYNAHSADSDVYALNLLLKTVDNFEEKMKTYTVKEIKTRLTIAENEKKYAGSYEQFIAKNIMTKTKVKKISGAGISVEHLKTINGRSGCGGLNVLFRQLVSAPEKTAKNVVKYFEEVRDSHSEK